MTTTTEMTYCAHCGRDVPHDLDEGGRKQRALWSIHDVPHLDGTVRTVAVCPSCRIGGRASEDHEPGSCPGTYRDDDAFVATCNEWTCKAQWSCWIRECVVGWQEEHYVDHDECPDCDGHHNSTCVTPDGKRI